MSALGPYYFLVTTLLPVDHFRDCGIIISLTVELPVEVQIRVGLDVFLIV